MHPNLVSPASLNLHLDQRELSVRRVDLFDHTIMRDSVAGLVSPCCHPGAVRAITADRSIDGATIQLGPTVHESDIAFVYFAAGEEVCELAMNAIVFRNDK